MTGLLFNTSLLMKDICLRIFTAIFLFLTPFLVHQVGGGPEQPAAQILRRSLFFMQGILFPILVLFVPTVMGGKLYSQMMDLGPLPNSQQQDVVVINAPSTGQSIYMLALRSLYGQTIPAHLRILATSREALGIAGEVAYRLPSLSLPEPAHASSRV